MSDVKPLNPIRVEATRRAWERRKADPAYTTAEQRRAARVLADLRASATAANVQARFGGRLQEVAEWCVSTCLAGGSSVHTAYLVAGEFTKGLATEWTTDDQTADA